MIYLEKWRGPVFPANDVICIYHLLQQMEYNLFPKFNLIPNLNLSNAKTQTYGRSYLH